MKSWEITVTETYSRTISVEAESMEDAEKLVKNRCDKRQIKLNGADIRRIEITGQHEGICPVCGSAHMEYDGHNIEDEGGSFPWVCLDCGARGEEVYLRNFIGHFHIEKEGDCNETLRAV